MCDGIISISVSIDTSNSIISTSTITTNIIRTGKRLIQQSPAAMS